MWEMIEWLRCFPYTLYILMFCLVSLRESAAVNERANEVSDSPAQSYSMIRVLIQSVSASKVIVLRI